MLAFVLALTTAAAPTNDLNRVQLLELMLEDTGFCSVGSRRDAFIISEHSPATNAALISMSTLDSLLPVRREQAIWMLLRQWKDPAVAEFFRTRFESTKPKTDAHAIAGAFLLAVSGSDRERVLLEFDTGDETFDRHVAYELSSTSADLPLSASAIDKFSRAFLAARNVDRRGAFAAVLLRYRPKQFSSSVLRSKDPRQLDALHIREDIETDDLIEGLAFANEAIREQLDRLLTHRLRASLSGRSETEFVRALSDELLSSSPRPGLSRAVTATYFLGSWAANEAEFERSARHFRAGFVTARSLTARHPDSRVLAGVLIAFRAQRVGVLLNEGKKVEAKALAKGLMNAIHESGHANLVLDLYSFGRKTELLRAVAELEK